MHWDRRAGVVAISLGLAVAATAFTVWAFSGTDSRKPGASEPTTADVNGRVTAKIEVGTAPGDVALGDGSVWVTVNEFEPSESWAIVQIDPTSDKVVANIPLNEIGDVAFGEGSLWVASWQQDESQILRIDPRSHEVVETIPIGRRFVDDFLVTDGQVWATTSSIDRDQAGEVIRIDPSAGEVTARIPLPGSPRDMLFAEGSLWVYGPSKLTPMNGRETASVYRIDPAAGRLLTTYLEQEASLGGGSEVPIPIAAGDGGIWVADVEQRAVRIDTVTGEISRHDVAGYFDWPFVVDGGGVWFWDGNGIGRLNTETFEVDAHLHIDYVLDSAFDEASGTIWLVNYRNTVTRVDLR